MSISQQTGKLLGILGALFLAHSAYSTYERMRNLKDDKQKSDAQHHVSLDLAYVKAVDEIDTKLPIEVMT